jgi:putative spermidine/putrescine transport system ATP-binding protein
VTHDQDEALSLADRIVVMREGEVRQVGRPEELYAAPAHLDVAEFMGFRNRLTGKVAQLSDGQATIKVGDTQLTGKASGPLQTGDDAAIVARPEDLVVGTNGIEAIVESVEYRGREFVGLARAKDGTELVFHAPERLLPGTAIHLTVDPVRAISFAVQP